MASTVLFDLDGTLIDSGPGIISSMHHGLEAIGRQADDHQIRSLIGIPLLEMFAHFGASEQEAQVGVDAYREAYHAGEIFNCTMFDGVDVLLKDLKTSGYTVAIATSKLESAAETLASHFNFSESLDLIAGCTLDGSRRHKTDVITYALSKLGTDPNDVVMIGDRSEDLNGGHANGTKSIGVTWGFGSRDELEACNPLAVVDSVSQLSEALMQRS